jgi:hypothetical protein
VFRSWFPTARKEPHGDNAKSRGPAIDRARTDQNFVTSSLD